VGETFLRCLAERFDQTNVIIELNSLKIAEDRTFADLARYILTTLLALCCPAPVWASREYRRLFAAAPPDVSTPGGKLALLKVFQGHLKAWGPLLTRFLKDGDDQVELLLTLEEWCEEEGVFEGAGEGGAAFTGVFTKLLQVSRHAGGGKGGKREGGMHAWR
jgi:translation initiation factor eIF-2B subunit epsilon